MNCPSRTDDTLQHDEWNQNPPRFAPDLTTCQDLNGIANARENRDDEKGSTGLHSDWNGKYVPDQKVPDTGNHPGSGRGVSLTPSGMSSRFLNRIVFLIK